MHHLLKKILVAIFLISLLVQCQEGDEVKDLGDPVGPIPAKEFEAATLPTYQSVINAYEAVTSSDPTLVNDESKLARAIFDWTQLHPNGRIAAGDSERWGMLSRLTWEEFKVVMRNPIDAYFASKTLGPSFAAGESSYPCDADLNVKFNFGKADAVRHAYWNILMAKATNVEFAAEFSEAHEVRPDNEEAGPMDRHNNKIGLALLAQYPDAPPEQLLELLTQKKFYFLKSPSAPIPAEAEGSLVYFDGKHAFDVTLSGTITNPDSGGPWNITMDFNQCDDVIRGQYTIVRGQASQKRRFEGTLSENGNITLSISNPYEFENPDNLGYCENMEVTLAGNTGALSGDWISSNCQQGGTIDITD